MKEIFNVRWADVVENTCELKRKDYFTADHVKVHEPGRGTTVNMQLKFGRLFAFSRTPLSSA